MKRLFLLFLAVVSLQVPAYASDVVLVPIFFGGEGAFGSMWRTRLSFFNNSDVALSGLPIIYPCAIPEGCQMPLPAHSAASLLAVDGFKYGNGFFIDPGTPNADLSIALRVFDASRTSSNYGTDVPVVPLSAFSTSKLELLDVPAVNTTRVTLRLYALPTTTPVVHVRVWQDETMSSPITPAPRLVLEADYQLQPGDAAASTASFSRPSGIVVSNLLAGVEFQGSARIEVQSTTPEAPIWALASVTNNDTQLVTIIVPRSTSHGAP